MPTNEGTIDRVIRAALGAVAILVAILWLTSPWNLIVGIAGGVLLLTAAIGFCPLYALFGASTCKVKN